MTTRSIALALTAFLLLAALPAHAQEPPKIATVDLQHLFKNYHRTDSAQKEINGERAKIQQNNNERLAGIKGLEAELQEMRKQLDNPAISDKKKQGIFKEFQIKTQEGVGMDKERREFLQRRNSGLNEKMVGQMTAILEEIRAKVEAHAKAEGYNFVVDKTGLSTSQTPLVLYSDIVDLTEALLAELNKDAPSGDGKSEAAPPAP